VRKSYLTIRRVRKKTSLRKTSGFAPIVESPCQVLQWQEELERIVDCMNPDKSNTQKRFELYGHVTRRHHGTLGKVGWSSDMSGVSGVVS
jgi:hypothetical protein